MRVQLCGDVQGDNEAGIYRYFGYTVCCPSDIRNAIKDCPEGEDLILEINSNGGSVYAGFEMYTLLRAHKGRTVAEVQSIAASAMSVIIAACDEVLMSPVSEIMIHRASVTAAGNSRDMKQAAQWLDTIDESILNAYVEKAGEKADRGKLARMMRNETFLTVQEAIDCGLADGILERAEKGQEEQQDGGLSYADLFPGLAAVAHYGAEAGADTPGDGDRLSVVRLVRDMQDVVKLIGRVQLPPVSDLIRRKEEREGMDSRQQGGVQDSLSGEPESVFTQNQDRRETGEMQDGKNVETPTTAEQLTEMYPELTRQIAAAAAMTAAAEAAKNERQRILEIDEQMVPGCEDLIAKAKADPNADAGSVAKEIIRRQRESGTNYLQTVNAEAARSHVNDVSAAAVPDARVSGADAVDEMGAAAREAVELWRKTKDGGEK